MSNIYYGIFIISSGCFALSFILLARIMNAKEILENDHLWLDKYQTSLKVVDELLAISLTIWAICFLFFLLEHLSNNRIIFASAIVFLFLILIVGVSIVILLGNLVYPVNGLSFPKRDFIQYHLLRIMASLHFVDLCLAGLTMTLALTTSHFLLWSGLIIGGLQIIFTYYHKPINFQGQMLSKIFWGLWFVYFMVFNSQIL